MNHILNFELFESSKLLQTIREKYKSSLSKKEFLDHLKERGMSDPFEEKAVIVGNGELFFVCYNLSGNIVGFQRYIPDGVKQISKENIDLPLKYLTKTNANEDLTCWGLHTYKLKCPYLFVVEGVWDAYILHKLGYPAIAVLTNNPLHLKSWLSTLPQTTIAICDDDVSGAGNKLKKLCNFAETTKGAKDLNDLYKDKGLNAVRTFIEEILIKYKFLNK